MKLALALLLSWPPLAAAAQPAVSLFNVTDYGAKGRGGVNEAAAIQKAIDAAAQAGGGVVWFPAGNFLSGTLVLKSNVTLWLSPGATLSASTKAEDYNPRHLIYARDAENIAIEGSGLIQGNGEAWWETDTERFFRPKKGRPGTLIELVSCRNVRIQDVTIRNAPAWTIHPLWCDGVKIRGISIINHTRGPNTDGIDLDSSRNVTISDCYVEAGDDCIVIKTTGRLGGKTPPSENITVTNCVLTTTCNNVKFGTESLGDFRNIAVSNCTMFRLPGTFQGPISGLAIEMVDGSVLDGLVFSNITMRDVRTPIFIRLGNRGRGQAVPTPGKLRNVSISNVTATGALLANSITGLPFHPVREVSLADINITMKGGVKEFRGLDVPENPDKYPEATMFGTLPAYGFYVRHVEGLNMRNVRVRWEEPDLRPAMIFDDVKRLDLDGFEAATAAGDLPILWYHQVTGALVRGARSASGASLFLRVTGADSRAVRIFASDLADAKQDVQTGPEVAKTAVSK
jgi:hypothetical protein